MLNASDAKKAAKSRFFSPATLTMSRDELDARHLSKIKKLIRYAYDHSPLHRRIYDAAGMKPEDVRSWDDFYNRVPFTDKKDYVEDQDRFGLAAEAQGDDLISAYFHTTGTTGKFLHEHYSEYDAIKMASIYGYAWWDSGVRAGDSIFINHNFGFWLGLWHMYWAARFFGLTIYSGGGMTTDQRIDAILARRATMVAGTPTYLLRLAQRAEERGIDLSTSAVKYVTAGGEPGLNVPVTRKAIEDAWGAVGIDAYGLSEVGIAHVECGAHAGGVHVMEDAFHSFSADLETGMPVADNEVGENIVTAYSHLAQPFIKYRTHDLVRRCSHEDHGCGWNWAFLKGGVLGRTDFMVTIKGVNVYPSAVENLIGEVAALTNQYELHITHRDNMDRMLVKVEAARGLGDDHFARLGEELVEVIRERLGVTLETEIVSFGTMERFELKTRRIFDHRVSRI
jgi:phenylacetate-CoA ligase